GFLKIIDKYSGTKAENLARYYAGMIYLKQGNFKNAISNLEKFDGDETIFETAANGALGDAYLESGNMEKALDFYKKAAADPEDNVLAPTYLSRAALICEKQNKTDKAIELYKRLKADYPQSTAARDIDKTLARLGVLD